MDSVLNLASDEAASPRGKRKKAADQPQLDFGAEIVRAVKPLATHVTQDPVKLDASPPEPPQAPFGEWLLGQKDRKGWIGDLAKAAKADRDFPKRGTPDEARRRLQQHGAEGDVFEALDDAELEWASL